MDRHPDAELPNLVIEKIVIGKRHRRDLGDLDALAESIKVNGLIQPVAVRDVKGTFHLVAGFRRLEAVKRLGWTTVPARWLHDCNDYTKSIRAERDENTCRMDFTAAEAVAIGAEYEQLIAPKAAERVAAGQAKKGNDGKKPTGSGKFPEPVKQAKSQAEKAHSDDEANDVGLKIQDADSGEIADIVGEAVGMSGKTYRKARAVVKAAEDHPDLYSDLAERLEVPGASVDAVHKELKRRQDSDGTRAKRARKVPERLLVIRDATGAEVPDELRDVFGDPWLKEATEWADRILADYGRFETRLTRWVKGKASDFGYLGSEVCLEAIEDAGRALKVIRGRLDAAAPHVICPDCKGDGCGECRTMGYMPAWRLAEYRAGGKVAASA